MNQFSVSDSLLGAILAVSAYSARTMATALERIAALEAKVIVILRHLRL